MVRLQRSQLGWDTKRSAGFSNMAVGGPGRSCTSEVRLAAEAGRVGWGAGKGRDAESMDMM